MCPLSAVKRASFGEKADIKKCRLLTQSGHRLPKQKCDKWTTVARLNAEGAEHPRPHATDPSKNLSKYAEALPRSARPTDKRELLQFSVLMPL